MIYFIRNPQSGNVKIGTSYRLRERLKALQVAHDSKLELVLKIAGGDAAETALHERFKAHWVRGEWFRCEGSLKAYLDELSSPVPDVEDSSVERYIRLMGPLHRSLAAKFGYQYSDEEMRADFIRDLRLDFSRVRLP